MVKSAPWQDCNLSFHIDFQIANILCCFFSFCSWFWWIAKENRHGQKQTEKQKVGYVLFTSQI